jgi:hypothetical protein
MAVGVKWAEHLARMTKVYPENLKENEYTLKDNIKLDHSGNASIGFIWLKILGICG